MPTSLADHLRGLPDEALSALITLRPDLVVPVPADISALAVRAQSRLSVARALDGLDRFTLQVLDAARLARSAESGGPGPSSLPAVLALTAPGGIEPERVRAAVDRLRALALLYGPDHALHVVAGVDEVSSPYPAGLGRPAGELDPAAGALAAEPSRLRRTLLSAPPAARAVLDRLAAGPPIGTVAPGMVVQGALAQPGSDSPVPWLVRHHLLVPVADGAVELPREVAVLLRREAGPLGPLYPDRPGLDSRQRDPAAVDQAGAGQALDLIRQVQRLAEALAGDPAPILRSGGLGVRDLRRLARVVDLDEAVTALLVEVAYQAGLITEGTDDGGEPVFLPTAGYDAWLVSALAERWVRLARGWLLMTRAPSLIGQRDERDRPIAALSTDVQRVGAPAQRIAALNVLADAPPGAAASAPAVLEVLGWCMPRRVARAASPDGYTAAVTEAAALGLIGLDALTGYGRALLAEVTAARGRSADDDPLGVRATTGGPGAVGALGALLPQPVEHVLVQADLSVVVPGPPTPALAAELALVADVESSGGASVYRVTTESVRRALDAGHTAADLHTLFNRRSRTPVPQALRYLVDDVARRHGGVRVGSAGAYLRSEDEGLVAEVAADRRLGPLGLRRLAPTVLVTGQPRGRLLAALREAGYAPVAEDSTGTAVLTRPIGRRAPARPAPATGRTDDLLVQPRLPEARAAGIVEQIRRGDAAARAARRAPVTVRAGDGGGPQAHAQALAVLQQALRDRTRVWVGYVDAHGTAARRLVRPVSMGAGYLRAEDERSEMLHTFALHRITAAVVEE